MIILVLGGFLIFDKVLKANKKLEIENNNEEIINNLAKSLYERTLAKDNYYYYYLYYGWKNNVLKEPDLKNLEKLTIAYKTASKDKIINKAYYSNKDNYIDSCLSKEIANDTECYIEKVSKEAFEKAYYDIFGNKNINYEDFTVDSTYWCKLSENSVICYDDRIGGDTQIFQHLRYKNAETKNNNIYLYVEMISKESEEDISEEEIFKKYPNEIKNYKVTFKLNENKDYYWYSTELIK